MSRHTLRWIIPFAFLAAACSASGSASAPKASVTHGASEAPPAAAPASPAGNPCDRGLVTKDDVAAILREPIVRVHSLAADGDAQSCAFETAAFASVTISLRPGLGDATVATWASGRMPMPAETIGGVGDRAVWSAELKEVIATKNDLLCDIGVGGPPGGSVASEVVKKRLGELCNKIFGKPRRS
jgi:hypothetical protein